MAEILDERDDIMKMLLTNLETQLTTHTVLDAKKAASNLGNDIPRSNSGLYNDDVLSKFVINFKIDYLDHNKIITWKVASKLRDLVSKKWKDEREFADLAKKGIGKLTPKERAKMNGLYQEMMNIDTVLKSYHLIPTAEELLDTLITRMEHADYSQSSLEPIQKEKQ